MRGFKMMKQHVIRAEKELFEAAKKMALKEDRSINSILKRWLENGAKNENVKIINGDKHGK